jgi:hypothetical protein
VTGTRAAVLVAEPSHQPADNRAADGAEAENGRVCLGDHRVGRGQSRPAARPITQGDNLSASSCGAPRRRQ